jgi:hypothetical protein
VYHFLILHYHVLADIQSEVFCEVSVTSEIEMEFESAIDQQVSVPFILTDYVEISIVTRTNIVVLV